MSIAVTDGVFRFGVCAFKHDIANSEIRISPYTVFETPDFATWRTPKENGIIWHVNTLAQVLTVLRTCAGAAGAEKLTWWQG